MTAGAAVMKLMQNIAKEQEVIMCLADMLMDTYVAESMLLRVEKLSAMQQDEMTQLKTEMMRIYMYDAAERIHSAGRNALNAFAEGDEKRMMMMGLKRFTKVEDRNTIAGRRGIAEKMIAENKYCF